ncbi:hypothetical protein [Phage f2b1]|nr:hypothetical protein [Phage f2b1]
MENFIKLEGYNGITLLADKTDVMKLLDLHNIEEFLADYTHDDTEYIFNYGIKMFRVKGHKILGYFIDRLDEHETVSPSTIFVAIDTGSDLDNIIYYAPIGQHSEGDREYLNDCTPITKERYLEISKNLYTPEAYL